MEEHLQVVKQENKKTRKEKIDIRIPRIVAVIKYSKQVHASSSRTSAPIEWKVLVSRCCLTLSIVNGAQAPRTIYSGFQQTLGVGSRPLPSR